MRRIRNSVDFDEQEVGRWLISYADFVTLLFAFFVVLYSISQVNVSKYKILSKTLEGVFDTPIKTPVFTPIGDPSLSLQPVTGDDIEHPEISTETTEQGIIDSENFASTEEFKDLQNGLEASLSDLIEQGLAEINSDSNWINIVLKSALLFPSGTSDLNNESLPLMEELVKHLNTNQQLILVHGHTDNIPIATEKFPSNWELSSARGVAVVRKLQSLEVQANRLSVEGHGEFQPIADNTTEEGRRKNRRVVISISRKQRVAPVVEPNSGAVNNTNDEISLDAIQVKEEEPEYEIIKLPGGGILIRGKESPQNQPASESSQ